MKKKNKRTLTPKLRFPEFRQGREWKHTCLAEAFETITNGKANSQDHQDDGEYPLFDRSEVVKRSPTFLFDAEAVILPGEGMSFQPRYFRGRFNLHQRAYALMDPKVIPFFAFYALDRFKSALADSAVHSTVRSLRMPIIEKFAIPCPETEAEQQKIVGCLSSLDELIAAEGRKLAALRDHKRGLMQQLFPQPGQTQPQLRFHEFRDAPEWNSRSLGDIAELKNGYAFRSSEYSDDGTYRIVTIANVQVGRLDVSSTKRIVTLPSDLQEHQLLSPGDILISMTGNVGRVCVVTDDDLLLNQRVGKLIPTDVDNGFFYQLINNDIFRNSMVQAAAGGAQDNVSSGAIKSYQCRVPVESGEQHCIADCLSALDTQITAQAAKIESLKQHKRGLMQQLFPSPEVS